ncbi:DUF4129 domain-containing protein [Pseudalkalibacillus sp. SCS-8]|uniref:DUF4129 domain-containing protein n=1 Tax=Pseudalkalibacillus nanhaiensis TaxID=3115291 RepID=UPI0032DB318E
MKAASDIRFRWLQYSMDVVLILLLSTWVFAPFNRNEYLSVFLLLLIGSIILELLFRWITVTTGKVLFSLPLIIFIGWLLGIDWFLIFVLTGFIGWRFTSHYTNRDIGQESAILLISCLNGLLIYVVYQSLNSLPVVFTLIVIQLVLFAAVRISRTLAKSVHTGKEVNSWLVKFLLLIGGLTAVFVFTFPWIESLFKFLAYWGGRTIAFIMYVPLQILYYLISKIEGDRVTEDTESGDDEDSDVYKEEILQQISNETGGDLLTYVLVTLLFLCLIWFGIKYFRTKLTRADSVAVGGVLEKSAFIGTPYTGEAVYSSSKGSANKIRKQLFRLERKLASYELGRAPHEPVMEWLNRIEAPSNLTESINRIYQIVRYGEKEVSDEEEKRYVNAIGELIAWAKERNKVLKKERKKEDS